jgi:hypothetical protein
LKRLGFFCTRALGCLAVLTALLPMGCSQARQLGDMAAPSQRDLGSESNSQSPILPNPHLSPGATLDVTVQDIGVPGYAHKVRNVPESVKRQVYAEYGITSHKPGEYEVDHLISLELGGSNSIKNLWPESYITQPWNAHVKDELENKLHDLVVSGQVPLATAQQAIATNWIVAYKKYFNTNQPLAKGYRSKHSRRSRTSDSDAPDSSSPAMPTPASSQPSDSSSGQVWVNTHSGKYFHSGSPYYGHTKQGQYMTEAQAQQQGYIAAR